MELHDLETLFWKCFDKLPEDDRKEIESHWGGRNAQIKITDIPLDTAGDVRGEKTNQFTFRAFALQWPKEYVVTLIKHEIAHAYLYASNLHPQVTYEKTGDSKKTALSLASSRESQRELNERLARKVNQDRWGSDEDAFDKYWEEFSRRLLTPKN